MTITIYYGKGVLKYYYRKFLLFIWFNVVVPLLVLYLRLFKKDKYKIYKKQMKKYM